MHHIFLLADLSEGERSQLFNALGGLLALVIIGSVVILIVRKKLRNTDDTEAAPMGFSLADLRKLRDDGELSPQEYEVAKDKIVANMKKKLDANPPKNMPKRKKPPLPGLGLPDDDSPV